MNHSDLVAQAQQELHGSDGSPPRYLIFDIKGIGSYGTVFRARDLESGSLVAVKRCDCTPNPNEQHDQGLSLTMIREAGLLRSLRHENIIQLKDVFLRASRMYLIQELCQCNLREYMEELQSGGILSMNPAKVKSFMRQMVSAIAFCCERRVIHRDMKPDNILLNETREVIKITDFGMARTYAPNNNYTERCVTAWYRPPEIILGNSMYGPPVDVWGLGCILAEMINLAPIFRCNTEFECMLLIFKHLGTPTEAQWPGVTKLQHFQPTFPQWPSQSARSVIDLEGREGQICPLSLDLLDKMLRLDPLQRIKAREALNDHPYFADDAGLPHYADGAAPAVAPATATAGFISDVSNSADTMTGAMAYTADEVVATSPVAHEGNDNLDSADLTSPVARGGDDDDDDDDGRSLQDTQPRSHCANRMVDRKGACGGGADPDDAPMSSSPSRKKRRYGGGDASAVADPAAARICRRISDG